VPYIDSGFGHGTAYSNYTFSRIAVSGSVRAGRSDGAVAAAGAFTVKVTVSDLAAYTPEGAAVVQVYAAPLSASRTGQVRYKKTLVGFTKANIAADVRQLTSTSCYTISHVLISCASSHRAMYYTLT